MREILSAIQLAIADFIFEWRLSACLVLGLAAVLAPLMVLFGLKYGIVEAIRAPMVENPTYRQITPVGAGTFTPIWFEQMRADPAVGFIIPRTRNIAATVQLRQPDRTRRADTTAELIPTASGDPVLGEMLAGEGGVGDVVLSGSAARKLKARVGEAIEAIISRNRNSRQERTVMQFTVVGIAPNEAFGRDGAFARLPLLQAVEDYRDGVAVPAFDWPGRAPVAAEQREYSSYRLYAKTLSHVGSLRERLEAIGLNVSTRATDIAVLRSLDTNLTLIFWIIASIGALGYLLSLGASLWSAVERKRKELSVLRLIGLGVGALVWFPVTQSISLAALGAIVASGAALGIANVLNTLFADSGAAGQFVCRLQPEHLLIASAITVVGAIGASTLAAVRCMKVDPAEGLREV
jgi:putative ABC transport system permease protein